MSDAIDTANKFCVVRDDDDRLRVVVLPVRPLSRADALNLAAWLVALADRRPAREDSDFAPVLKAILGT